MAASPLHIGYLWVSIQLALLPVSYWHRGKSKRWKGKGFTTFSLPDTASLFRMGTASQRLLIYLPSWKWVPWLPLSPEDTEETVSRAEEERKEGLGMALLVHSVGHGLARPLGVKVW